MSPLPTFVVIGAMKAGTTSLGHYLNAHPDVFVPEIKEPQFFAEDDRWRLGVSWYERLFQDGDAAKARGELSTGYTKYPTAPDCAERMHSVIPNAKLVYLVREPIDRIRSHYVHNVLDGYERQPLRLALQGESNYVSTSSYGSQLDRYRGRYDDEKILVMFSEDLRDDPVDAMRRLFEFIGVDPSVLPVGAAAEFSARHFDTRSRQAVRSWLRPLSRSRRVQVLRTRLPRPVRRTLKRVAHRDTHSGEIDDALPRDVERELEERLAPEVEAVRARAGVLPEAWARWR